MAPIQAYCDKHLNLGSEQDRGFTYKPASFWPYALLLFIDYPVMINANQSKISTGPAYSDRGVVTQKEVFVALPVMRIGKSPTSLLMETTIECVLPFIVVDNPMSAICGREMLGLEKLLAQIDLGESTFPDSFRARVSLPGWAKLSPDEMQRELPFLDVDTAPTLPTFRGSSYETSPWTLFRSREAESLMDTMGNAASFVDATTFGLLPTEMRLVSLKQFRDALDPGKAIYQALVSCRSSYKRIENFIFYNEKDVNITFHNQGSFSEILSVFLNKNNISPSADKISFSPKAAFRFNATIDFYDMRTIHTFGVDRGPGLPPIRASSDLTAPWLRPWKGFWGAPGR